MLKVAVAGIGGYAGIISRGLLRSAADGQAIKLIATCDPRADDQPQQRDDLKKSGVPVFDSFEKLLDTDADVIWLPIPIDLHCRFTTLALSAGKAVIVEKPAAGTIDEVDAMIAARDRVKRPVAVGFQNLFDPNAWSAKRLLLDGLIGQIRSGSVMGCWPRNERYFSRATWAGRIDREGTWVLDSPINNAMAHFVNLALFLLGDTAAASAVPAVVEAELLRAYSIEMFDTCYVRAETYGDASLSIALTHACRDKIEPVITIHGTAGTLRFLHEDSRYEFFDSDGKLIKSIASQTDPIRQIIQQFSKFMAGDAAAPIATLENARSHTMLVNAVSEAAVVHDVPLSKIELIGNGQRAIRSVETHLHDSIQHGNLLARTCDISTRLKAGRLTLRDYQRFQGPRSVPDTSRGEMQFSAAN